MKRAIACAAVASLSLGCAGLRSEDPSPPVAGSGPARVFVRSLTGLAGPPATPRPARVAVVLDATGAMARVTPAGPSHLTSARAAVTRLLEGLDEETDVALRVIGGSRRARCETPAQVFDPASPEQLSRIGARGAGSISHTLELLLDAPDPELVDRAVVFTRLVGTCDEDLCKAAGALAERGVRLDLVVIGEEPAPPCLAGITPSQPDTAPEGWHDAPSIHFHAESVGPEPAIQACSETDGLPVMVQPGDAAIVIDMEPSLRVERRFEPGSRWLLEVVAFPGLDPPERIWRWRALPEGPVSAPVEAAP